MSQAAQLVEILTAQLAQQGISRDGAAQQAGFDSWEAGLEAINLDPQARKGWQLVQKRLEVILEDQALSKALQGTLTATGLRLLPGLDGSTPNGSGERPSHARLTRVLNLLPEVAFDEKAPAPPLRAS